MNSCTTYNLLISVEERVMSHNTSSYCGYDKNVQNNGTPYHFHPTFGPNDTARIHGIVTKVKTKLQVSSYL